MSWTRSQVRSLIYEVRKYPCLYMVKSKQYVNKHMRQKALVDIQNALQSEKPDVTIADIKTKFAGVKSTFYTEHKKYKDSLKSGMGEDDIYHPSLWYFEDMQFVLEHIEPRDSNDSLSLNASQVSQGDDDTNEYDLEEHQQDTMTFAADNETETSSSDVTLNLSPDVIDESHLTHDTENSVVNRYSSASRGAEPKQKKRKVVIESEDKIIKAATETLQSLSSAMAPKVARPSDDDQILASFITSKLNQIKNKKIRFESEEQITKILYDAIKKDLD